MKGVLILFILSLAACSAQVVAPVGTYNNQEKKAYKLEVIVPTLYKVKRGDTLFSISLRYGYDHRILAMINDIKFPYTIYVNEDIRFQPSKMGTRSTKLISKEMITLLNEK